MQARTPEGSRPSDDRRHPPEHPVTHPEHFVRIEVPTRRPEEAQRVACQRCYRRPVRTGLDELTRDMFDVTDTLFIRRPRR